MSEPNVQEPTMEEILASIRRIISEDEPQGESEAAVEAEAAPAPVAEAPVAEAPVVEAESEEVLELTDPLPAPEPEPVQAFAEPEPAPEPEPVIEPEPEPFPEPVAMAEPIAEEEPLVGDPAADRTASAFGHLARSLTMPKEGRTLEDVVREMLNPLLKAWLDEHLPAIVQAKVEEEVERIARRRVR